MEVFACYLALCTLVGAGLGLISLLIYPGQREPRRAFIGFLGLLAAGVAVGCAICAMKTVNWGGAFP